jgi:hypothetical protein
MQLTSLTLPVRNSPKTSVMLCVLMPPPRILSASLDPVLMWRTFDRRFDSSAAERKAGGYHVS